MDRNTAQLNKQLTTSLSGDNLCEEASLDGVFNDDELAKLERQLIPLLNTIRAIRGKAPLVSADKLTA